MMKLRYNDGVAIFMYAPAIVNFTIPPYDRKVSVEIVTDYPFDGNVTVYASCSWKMFLSFRIPSWTLNPVVTVNGTARVVPDYPVLPGKMYEVACFYNTVVKLTFPMKIRVTRRFNNAASIYRG